MQSVWHLVEVRYNFILLIKDLVMLMLLDANCDVLLGLSRVDDSKQEWLHAIRSPAHRPRQDPSHSGISDNFQAALSLAYPTWSPCDSVGCIHTMLVLVWKEEFLETQESRRMDQRLEANEFASPWAVGEFFGTCHSKNMKN